MNLTEYVVVIHCTILGTPCPVPALLNVGFLQTVGDLPACCRTWMCYVQADIYLVNIDHKRTSAFESYAY